MPPMLSYESTDRPPPHTNCRTSSGLGPTGSSFEARLHCTNGGRRIRSGSHRRIRHTHLMKHPHLVLGERADDAVQDAAVVKQREVLFLPIDRVDELWRRGRV